jgi:hypothetical protein
MDITALANSTTALLALALPYLIEPGKKAAEEIAKKIGADVWDGAKTIWAKLRSQVGSRPAALEAAHDLALQPDNRGAQNALQWQLEKLFNEDRTLAGDVEQLLSRLSKNNVTVIASGEGAVAIGGDAVASTIITGDNNELVK